jgi:hypothetical protein
LLNPDALWAGRNAAERPVLIARDFSETSIDLSLLPSIKDDKVGAKIIKPGPETGGLSLLTLPG